MEFFTNKPLTMKGTAVILIVEMNEIHPKPEPRTERNRIMSLNCSMVVYDIPSRLGNVNPSPTFRRIGVRVNLSCWVVPTELIPYETLAELQEMGATWHKVKFSADEADNLIDLAKAYLTAELEQAEESLKRIEEQSEARRVRQETSATDENEVAAANRQHWNRCRTAVWNTRRLIDDLNNASNIFGVSIRESIRTLAGCCEAIRETAYAKAEKYVRAYKKMDHVYPAMMATARESLGGLAVASDYAEENGECELAETLREAAGFNG